MLGKWIGTASALSCAALLLAGCDTGPERPFTPTSPDDRLLAAQGATTDRDQPVLRFSDFAMVGGSQLVRTPTGVNFNLSTTDLAPGHAYTLWIVIFNNPAGCLDGTEGFAFCGPDDVVNALARPDMMFAAGLIAGGSGRGNFAGRRSVGDLSGSANGPVDLPAYGLEDARSAEVHLVVHDHGPKIAQFLPDMIQSIDGGCTDAGIPFEGADTPWNNYAGDPGVGAYGLRGPNTCASTHFAVHRP